MEKQVEGNQPEELTRTVFLPYEEESAFILEPYRDVVYTNGFEGVAYINNGIVELAIGIISPEQPREDMNSLLNLLGDSVLGDSADAAA